MEDIEEVLKKGKNPTQMFNRLKGTIGESSKTTSDDLHEAFRMQDYTSRDSSFIDLSEFLIGNVNFTDYNLTSATFADSRIRRCDFTNANLKFSNFRVKSIAPCVME